jgi:4-amino-4-deoxy-L-arabinose transferase-like glycosyltransferase
MSSGHLARLRAWSRTEPRWADGFVVLALGLTARLVAVAWAAGRFPPVEDGRFYQVLATRLAEGHGYTWQWPDGVVTHVAHYPVGYPAFVAAGYALFGAHPAVAMLENALLGALGVLAVHRVAVRMTTRLGALTAAVAVALHPALVLYTPALMTEGVTAALLAVAAWIAIGIPESRGRGRFVRLAGLGVWLGVSALIRGQTLLVAPLFGAVAGWAGPARLRSAALAAGVSTLFALVAVAPWTARNCQKMDRCVAISANLGWNLLIGSAPDANGTFVPITGDNVPAECRTVFGEADKDACFTRASVAAIAARPLRWAALVPKKLSHTFDYCGAAGWYLHASNPAGFSDRAKVVLGAAETAWQRILLVMALGAVAAGAGPWRRARQLAAAVGVVALLTPSAWVGYLALGLGALLPRSGPRAGFLLVGLALGATALTHAVFFGAGRYSLPLFALTALLAGAAFGSSDER